MSSEIWSYLYFMLLSKFPVWPSWLFCLLVCFFDNPLSTVNFVLIYTGVGHWNLSVATSLEKKKKDSPSSAVRCQELPSKEWRLEINLSILAGLIVCRSCAGYPQLLCVLDYDSHVQKTASHSPFSPICLLHSFHLLFSLGVICLVGQCVCLYAIALLLWL